jgi:TetR/AcrR family transcriptional regulator, transcriptional repressor for nem operon
MRGSFTSRSFFIMHHDRYVWCGGAWPRTKIGAVTSRTHPIGRNEQKQQTRQRIVQAATQGFRRQGFGGLGVDGLAKEAGVTSGAFYVHFGSKSEAFAAAVFQGLDDLRAGVLQSQAQFGRDWWPQFVRFYLSERRTCDLGDSCALQSLSPEVGRADATARAAFEAGFDAVLQAIVNGPRSPAMPRDAEAAQAALATLVGAVTLARAVGSERLSEQIAAAAGRALLGARWDSSTTE